MGSRWVRSTAEKVPAVLASDLPGSTHIDLHISVPGARQAGQIYMFNVFQMPKFSCPITTLQLSCSMRGPSQIGIDCDFLNAIFQSAVGADFIAQGPIGGYERAHRVFTWNVIRPVVLEIRVRFPTSRIVRGGPSKTVVALRCGAKVSNTMSRQERWERPGKIGVRWQTQALRPTNPTWYTHAPIPIATMLLPYRPLARAFPWGSDWRS